MLDQEEQQQQQEDQRVVSSDDTPGLEVEVHQSLPAAATTYSLYEPHYQQMHPLIYYEDPGHHQLQQQPQLHQHPAHHHHHHHLHAPHPWDQDHYIHLPAAATLISAADHLQHQYQNQHQHQHQQQSAAHGLELGELRQELGSGEGKEVAGVDPGAGARRRDREKKSRKILGASVEGQSESRAAKDRNNEDEDQDEDDNTSGADGALKTNSLNPCPAHNRELHNEIERRRRLRIKNCCEILRTLVPGLTDKTDKATVLEHTVTFVSHLASCSEFKCRCLRAIQ